MTKPDIHLYDVTIIETVAHRAQLEAHDIVHLNEIARSLWDGGDERFTMESLGRADLIIADEVRS